MDLLAALTCGCLILFKTTLFVWSWVLTELLLHPVYVEANEPPLYFRRKKLSLQYCLKLSCNYNNPAYATVFNFKFHSVFESKPTQLPPLAIHVSGDLQAVGFKKSDVITSFIPTTPPWLLTSLYTARTKATLLPKYSNIVFMNSLSWVQELLSHIYWWL